MTCLKRQIHQGCFDPPPDTSHPGLLLTPSSACLLGISESVPGAVWLAPVPRRAWEGAGSFLLSTLTLVSALPAVQVQVPLCPLPLPTHFSRLGEICWSVVIDSIFKAFIDYLTGRFKASGVRSCVVMQKTCGKPVAVHAS